MDEIDQYDRTRRLFEFTIMSPRVDTIEAWLAAAPERERADALLADWESLFRADLARPGRQAHASSAHAEDPEQALAEVIERREQLAAAAARAVRATETVAGFRLFEQTIATSA